MDYRSDKYIVDKNWASPTHQSSLILIGLNLNLALNKLATIYPNHEWSVSLNAVVINRKRRDAWLIYAWDVPLTDPQHEITSGCPNSKLNFWLFVNQNDLVVEVWPMRVKD